MIDPPLNRLLNDKKKKKSNISLLAERENEETSFGW